MPEEAGDTALALHPAAVRANGTQRAHHERNRAASRRVRRRTVRKDSATIGRNGRQIVGVRCLPPARSKTCAAVDGWQISWHNAYRRSTDLTSSHRPAIIEVAGKLRRAKSPRQPHFDGTVTVFIDPNSVIDGGGNLVPSVPIDILITIGAPSRRRPRRRSARRSAMIAPPPRSRSAWAAARPPRSQLPRRRRMAPPRPAARRSPIRRPPDFSAPTASPIPRPTRPAPHRRRRRPSRCRRR